MWVFAEEQEGVEEEAPAFVVEPTLNVRRRVRAKVFLVLDFGS